MNGRKQPNPPEQSNINELRQQLDAYKKEKEILLALSDDITKAREKSDLVKVLSSRLKEYFYFTHAVISLIDNQKGTYFPFLIDRQSMHIRHRSELPSLLKMNFPINDPFLGKVAGAEVPVSFLLDEIINEPGIPAFLKVNYDCGIRKAMIAKLKDKMETVGFVFMYSDRTDSFPDDLNNILLGIAPHLSNAVTNIIINEEILEKDKDKSFLVEFSHDIAYARTKNELSQAIHGSLKKLAQVRAYFIRTINEDCLTLSPFMHDDDVHYKDDPEFKKLLATRIDKTEGLSGRVLSGNGPVLIDFEEEIKQGNTDHYIEFWKGLGSQKVAFQKMVGSPLRTGNMDLGILWVVTDQINLGLLEGITAQMSIAISNIRSNEEIVQREKEKSILLSLSTEIAALRSRDDLERVVNTKIKTLFNIEDFGFLQINDDQTYSTFTLDLRNTIKNQTDFLEITSGRYSVDDVVFTQMIASEDPIIFDINELAENPKMPKFVYFWKKIGLQRVLGTALRVGGDIVGCAFLHLDQENKENIKINLVKSVFAQISVAIANILANEKVLAFKQLLEIENDHLKEQIKTIYNFSEIIGTGDAMQKVYRLMSLVADSDTTVLVLGETGTGKELIARAIHNSSPRKDKLMVKVNCAALPANLIESELFGHERGAFTGASERRIGKFELANHSTIFLDEIGELPLDAQSKLLRVIQEREFERVGGKQTIKTDVRLVAATNRNLEDEVSAGRFRADLYFRLNVFPISLPSLRERSDDIEALTQFFVQKYSRATGRKIRKIAPKVIQQLRSYTWPGNVRELQHLIERSILLTTNGILDDVYIPQNMNSEKREQAHLLNRSMEEVERDYIIETLKRCAGKISGTGGAAEILKVPGNTLHSKMKKLGIEKSDYFSK